MATQTVEPQIKLPPLPARELGPEVLGWAGTPGEAPNAASARNQGPPDANAALARRK